MNLENVGQISLSLISIYIFFNTTMIFKSYIPPTYYVNIPKAGIIPYICAYFVAVNFAKSARPSLKTVNVCIVMVQTLFMSEFDTLLPVVVTFVLVQ